MVKSKDAFSPKSGDPNNSNVANTLTKFFKNNENDFIKTFLGKEEKINYLRKEFKEKLGCKNVRALPFKICKHN